MEPGGKKLRLGVLVDSLDVQAWVLRCLERIIESDHTEIALIVLPGDDSQVPKKPLSRRLIENRKQLAWHGHCRFEQKFFKSSPDAFEVKNAEKLLAGVPQIPVTPRRTKFSDYIESPDLEKIAACGIDVFVRFGFRILRGEILNLAPGGVWSFHHGDNTQYRGGPPGVWEIFENNPVTGAVLQRLDESLDDGVVLDRIFCATDYASVLRTQNGLFWTAMSMLPRALERLDKLGQIEFFTQAKLQNHNVNTSGSKIYHEPGNLQTFKLFINQAHRVAKRKIRNLLTQEQWAIMYRLEDKTRSFDSAQDDTLGSPTSARDGTPNIFPKDLKKFKLLLPPRDKFHADPFVIERDGLYHVFLEELDRRTGRGHISWMTIDQAGNCSTPEPILRQPYHMSYPFIFEHSQELYMIPETYENCTVEIYRCDDFPKRWELCKTILKNVVAFDPTLLHHDEKYWLFVNIVENPGGSFNDELFLFSAENPLSDNWQGHPMNPIVSDVRSARGGGRIFEHEGKLYRPSQDCSGEYGYAVGVQEILTLTDSQYSEREVARIEPGQNPKIKCVHTFNQAGNLTVLDVRLDRSIFA